MWKVEGTTGDRVENTADRVEIRKLFNEQINTLVDKSV